MADRTVSYTVKEENEWLGERIRESLREENDRQRRWLRLEENEGKNLEDYHEEKRIKKERRANTAIPKVKSTAIGRLSFIQKIFIGIVLLVVVVIYKSYSE